MKNLQVRPGADADRPEHDRGMLANAFVAKAVLGISTTAGLVERLAMDRTLKRICGFSILEALPRKCDRGSKFNAQGYKERSQAERSRIDDFRRVKRSVSLES